MFKVGELIHYGSTGVCRVTDITTRDNSDEEKNQLYYILSPLYQSYIISTPVDADKIFMRPIISKEEAQRLIDRIPTIHAEPYRSRVQSELTKHYEAILKTYDCADLTELIKSIYAKKQYAEQQNQRFGAVDERFLKQAEGLLFGELAAALDIPRESVSQYIDGRIGKEGGIDQVSYQQ